VSNSVLSRLARRIRRLAGRGLSRIRTRYLKVRYRAENVGRRAVTGASMAGGDMVFRKHFVGGAAESPMAAELMARGAFGDRPWMVPIRRAGRRWIEMPRLEPEQRLDRVLAAGGGGNARAVIARQAMEIAVDLFIAGFAHRDFHARNLFWDGQQLRLVDFETMVGYTEGERPAFWDSYDFSGNGLPTPYQTQHMGFIKEHPAGLAHLLGLDRDGALALARDILMDRLHAACRTFKTTKDRHECRAGRIYGSFALPGFAVSPDIAQRDSARRLRNFGIRPEWIEGQSCLDLGCNVGAILFELQRFGPSASLGLEYDQEKVDAAQAVAAFAGLRKVEFDRADIDELGADEVGAFDNVFCLALVEHVKNRRHLYDLLGQVTGRRLFFEGNSRTSVDQVRQELLRVGFAQVDYLGLSDDDCRPENNRRPLLIATRDP
jgi:SAM-dependent methyltransferase